jgi:hypothetical protein
MTAVALYDASFDDANVTMLITVDDQSLVVQELIYHNATSQPGALMLTGPRSHTFPCPANTDRTLNLTGLNVVCTKRTGTGKGGPYVAYELPNGEQVSFQWPA